MDSVIVMISSRVYHCHCIRPLHELSLCISSEATINIIHTALRKSAPSNHEQVVA